MPMSSSCRPVLKIAYRTGARRIRPDSPGCHRSAMKRVCTDQWCIQTYVPDTCVGLLDVKTVFVYLVPTKHSLRSLYTVRNPGSLKKKLRPLLPNLMLFHVAIKICTYILTKLKDFGSHFN